MNYSPDRAIQFDLGGDPAKVFDRAYRLGTAQLLIGGRPFSQAELANSFGYRRLSKV